MATGNTNTGSLADSLPTMISDARLVQEYEGVVTQLVDRVTLPEHTGNTWNEISLAKLTASAITETTEENNPQQIADTLLSVTPTMISCHTVVTDRAKRNVSANVIAKIGPLGQSAIERKKDIDGLVALQSGGTGASPGAAAPLTSGHIAAATVRIRGNTTEPWGGQKPVCAVLHSFQGKDLFDELVAGVGTYGIPAGPSAQVFQEGYRLPVMRTEVFFDDNITIDGSDDAKGGVFARGAGGAMILVQARAPSITTVRNEKLGGGAEEVLHRDEYAYGERSAGNWLYIITSDALAPTS